MDEPGETFCVVLVTARADLLEWPALAALYEVGCGDATIGRNTLEFARAAHTRDEALCSAMRDVESVPGVAVMRVEFSDTAADHQ